MKMFDQIRRLRSRVHKLFTLTEKFLDDRVTMAPTQMALAEARNLVTIQNPRQAVSFFMDCFKPLIFSMVYKVDPKVNLDLVARVNAMLQFSDATVPFSVALPIALYADEMLSNFGFESYSGDIGYHFSVGSSLGTKARLVFNLVRALKPKSCLEIGTAYGISAFLIARCQELCSLQPHVVTVEKYSPQKEIGASFLQKHCAQSVKTIHADKHDAIAKLMAASKQFDFVFHDCRHSGDEYVDDFTELLPLMSPNAVFVLDDLHWHGRGAKESRRTCYEGWLEIIKHERVNAAIEIENSMGMIFLR